MGEIVRTKYTGNTDSSNDAYFAILEASRQHFRPGASRVIFLFNTEAHTSHKNGPSPEETMTALTEVSNASLFVFDKVAFKNIRKNKIIGQTNRKIYTNSHLALPSGNLQMPASEFTELVQKSQGGLFANKLKKVPRIAHAVYNGVREWLMTDSQLCKKARVSTSIPTVNIWCAHTTKPRTPIAIIAKIMPRVPNACFLPDSCLMICEIIPKAGRIKIYTSG